MLEPGREVVFWGGDSGEEEVRGTKMQQNFARSMSLADAMHDDILLCYEMNGAALPAAHGFPLRLIAPGWYGIANVKWLERIEVRDTRYMGRFMARDYVTLREEQQNGRTVWAETSVGRSLLKSMPVRVSRKDGQYQVVGMAWGGADRASGGADRRRPLGRCQHRSQRGGPARLEALDPRMEGSRAGPAFDHFASDRHRRQTCSRPWKIPGSPGN